MIDFGLKYILILTFLYEIQRNELEQTAFFELFQL